MFPADRPRRLRSSRAMRRLVAETSLDPRQLVLPMFVAEGADEPTPISSMPGVVQHTRDSARDVYARAAEAGIGGVMLFGVPESKDPLGSGGWDLDGILNRALADARSQVGDELLVMRSEEHTSELQSRGHLVC